MIKSLRKCGVDWAKNVDLRGQISTGHKSAATRAYNTIKDMAYSRYIPLKRNPGESKKAYSARLTDFKAKHGQDHTPAKGLFINIPSKRNRWGYAPEIGYDAERNDISIKGIHVDEDRGEFIETNHYFIPLDVGAYLADPANYLLEVIRSIPDETYQNGKRRPVRIRTEHYVNVGDRGFAKDSWEEFIKRVLAKTESYGVKTISGFQVEYETVYEIRRDGKYPVPSEPVEPENLPDFVDSYEWAEDDVPF